MIVRNLIIYVVRERQQLYEKPDTKERKGGLHFPLLKL